MSAEKQNGGLAVNGGHLENGNGSTHVNGESKDVQDLVEKPVHPPYTSLVKNRSLAQQATAALLDSAEWLLDLWTHESKENYFLSGNFAPTLELPSVDVGLKISGQLPAYLNGEFVRVGANPEFLPTTGYHWFDGDGMLHGVRISDGSASYVNRYVRTNKLLQEEAYARPIFPKLGQLRGLPGVLRLQLLRARAKAGLVDTKHGTGTANTAVVFHSGSLLALQEGDMPYAVRVLVDGELETLGRLNYAGKLEHSLTAHPKVDPVTGDLFTFGYNVTKTPYVTYRVVSASGELGPKVPITVPEPVMMHDFAITKKHAIFLDLPVVFDPKDMVAKNISLFVWRDRPARFGLLPRGDSSEVNIRWFSLPPLFIFHTGNAWEEGEDEVVLYACRFNKLNMTDLDDNTDPVLLTEFRFNLKSGTATENKVSDIRCDFPKINEGLIGRKSRYMYTAAFDGIADIVGVIKFDLSKQPKFLDHKPSSTVELAVAEASLGGCVAAFFDFGTGRFGSESVFVPRPGAPLADAEDDGCLLSMVFDSQKNLSEVVVIDAKTMSPTPLAVIYLNTRVPFGFHGTFVTEEQLKQQDLE